MRYVLFIAAIYSFSACNSGSNKKESGKVGVSSAVAIDTHSIPPEFSIAGSTQYAWRWKDQQGDNYLIFSNAADTAQDEITMRIHAVQYAFANADFSTIWSYADSVQSCEFDITCEFIKDAISITDLDNDGKAEVTFQVKKACRSDVSPAVVKLIMHEGADKFQLEGLSWIRASMDDSFTVKEEDANLEKLPGYTGKEEEFMKTFGRYESEKNFSGAPPEFLSFARKQWMKFIIEKVE